MSDSNIFAAVDARVRAIGNVDPDDVELGATTHLLDEGFLDSLALVNAVVQLEGEFGIKFTDSDMVRVDFATVQGLADLIAAKLAQA